MRERERDRDRDRETETETERERERRAEPEARLLFDCCFCLLGCGAPLPHHMQKFTG